jgi:hypothetical protein
MENVGDDSNPKWVRKYKLSDLLEPDFRLPLEPTEDQTPFQKVDGILYDEVR